jgi:hypothetical protein
MKLCNAGVDGTALLWLESYLNNRSMSVKIEDTLSKKFPLNSGVPQGSVLGPLLFNVYMAGLARLLATTDVCFHMYADDTILYAGFNNNSMLTVFEKLQTALSLAECCG